MLHKFTSRGCPTPRGRTITKILFLGFFRGTAPACRSSSPEMILLMQKNNNYYCHSQILNWLPAWKIWKKGNLICEFCRTEKRLNCLIQVTVTSVTSQRADNQKCFCFCLILSRRSEASQTSNVGTSHLEFLFAIQGNKLNEGLLPQCHVVYHSVSGPL